MKTPKLFSKLSAVLTPRPKKRLQATARVARPTMDDYDEEEPTTKLSSAFLVVLILHVVAVGGIYAFNSIKASRRDRETTTAVAEPAASKASMQTDKAAVSPLAATAAAAPVPAIATLKPAIGKQYEVKAGDNLTKIAFAYNVTAADVMEANHLKDGAMLHPGQILAIPAPKAATRPVPPVAHKPDATAKQTDIPPTTTTPGLYTVKKGDTAISIAHAFGLTAEDLLKANKVTDPKKLQLGQVMKVPPRKN